MVYIIWQRVIFVINIILNISIYNDMIISYTSAPMFYISDYRWWFSTANMPMRYN